MSLKTRTFGFSFLDTFHSVINMWEQAGVWPGPSQVSTTAGSVGSSGPQPVVPTPLMGRPDWLAGFRGSISLGPGAALPVDRGGSCGVWVPGLASPSCLHWLDCGAWEEGPATVPFPELDGDQLLTAPGGSQFPSNSINAFCFLGRIIGFPNFC